MSFIRGALPFLVYNPHTQDDIIPDGISSTFELSQEVPGGYEQNVQVLRRELKSHSLITSCELISFTGVTNKISCSNAAVAAALSILQAGDILRSQGAANSENNGDFLINSVVYDGSIIEITVEDSLVTESVGASVSLIRRYSGFWENLEPAVDYTISGIDAQYNRLINFAKIPQEQDVIYVFHRGEATFNNVPTEKSVGPNQLQDNLRNFVVDIFTGDGSTTLFNLSQFAVNGRTIEVSVNGTVKYADDPDLSFTGDFTLAPNGVQITFAVAPGAGQKIYVRHLGFSTVSRRQALTPSQIGSVAPGAIGTLELANNSVIASKIADGNVSKSKLQAGAVDGSIILMLNNEWLNWKSGTGPGNVGVLKLDSNNLTTLRSAGGTLSINVADSKLYQFSNTAFAETTGSGQIDIGTNTNKFRDAFFTGSINADSLNLTGDLEVGDDAHIGGDLQVDGNISPGGTVDGVDIAALQAQVNALASLVSANSPAGDIRLWAKNAAAPAGFLLCDGALYSTATYPALFAAIGYLFGGSGGNFAVPDFRGRFPLGKAASGTGSGWGTAGQGGSLDHTHGTPNHTHGLANHVHFIASHYHGVIAGNSTINVTSSGSHFTAIDHNHGTLNTGAGTAHSHGHTLGTGAGSAHTHTIDHTHPAVNTSTESANHTHSGTTNTDGAHNHEAATSRGTGLNSGSPSGKVDKNDGSTNSNTGTVNIASTSSNHSHAFSTGINSVNHVHAVPAQVHSGSSGSESSHTHSITGGINNESAHTHSITIPAISANSASSGVHAHGASDFAGAIGNVNTGADGNAGFNSGPPSPNVTDSGGAGTTGGSNPAFQTIHFIIKT